MIKFYCSKCGKGIKAPDKYAGKTVKCPSCQSPNLLPVEKEVLPYQLEIETDNYDGVFCQQCGNKIKKEAFVCPKCGCKNSLTSKTQEEVFIGTGSIVASYFLSVLVPLLGIIAGIYLMVKGKVAHGVACILISIFIGIPLNLSFMSAMAV